MTGDGRPLAVVFERLDRYEADGEAHLIMAPEADAEMANVAETWLLPDAAEGSRALARRVWYSLATLHAYRSIYLTGGERDEERSLALHYFSRAGKEAMPRRALRDRLAMVAQDDWLAQIGDGRDQDRLADCVRNRNDQAIAACSSAAVSEPQAAALALALVEAALAGCPGADADPPTADSLVWCQLGLFHELLGYAGGDGQLLENQLSDYYFVQIAAAPGLPAFVVERLGDNPWALGPEVCYPMAIRLQWEYQRTGRLEALYAALHLLRRAAAPGAEAGADPVKQHMALAYSWFARFTRGGQPGHLERALEHARTALGAHAPVQPEPRDAAILLREALESRFQLTADGADLDQAITIGRELLADGQERGACLRLADLLQTRYAISGDADALAEAEQIMRAALADLPDDDELRPSMLNTLGTTLGIRHAASPADHAALDAAIVLFQAARDAVPAWDRRLPLYQDNLGKALTARHGPGDVLAGEALAYFEYFQTSGDTAALEAARDRWQRAIDGADRDDPRRADYLSEMCLVLWRLAQRKNDPLVAGRAVDAGREAVATTASADPGLAIALSNLGIALRHLSGMLDEPTLFEEGLDCARRAVVTGPSTHSADPGLFHNNLGNALNQQAMKTGDLQLLDEAIEQKQAAVDITPDGHPAKSVYWSNLGSSLMTKHDWLRDSTALAQAVDAFGHAVAEVPDHDRRAARYHLHLGSALIEIALLTGQREVFNAAVSAVTSAVEATEEDHPDRAGRLAALSGLYRRFAAADGEPPGPQAYQHARQALAAARPGNPQLAVCLRELAATLLAGYDGTADMTLLSECVRHARQAVADARDLATSAQCRLTLVSALSRLYASSGRPAVLRTEMLDQLRAVVTALGPTDDRIDAARRWAEVCADSGDWAGVLEATEAAVELVPLLVSRRLGRHDQNVAAAHLQGMASVGAAAALLLEQPERAVELLEAGRGAVLGRALESKTELRDLQVREPLLAERYLRLARELDTIAYSLPTVGREGAEDEDRGDTRERIAAKLDAVLAEIRTVPGFERFLLPVPYEQLVRTADNGPVVIVNASSLRCDALVLTRQGIRPVPLPGLSLQTAMEQADRLFGVVTAGTAGTPGRWVQAQQTVHEILAWLWDTIADPVLTALDALGPPPERMWWCPVGPVTYLPLHAAGHHRQRGGPRPQTVLDRVVSSYTPTLRSLLHARRVPADSRAPVHELLVVAMSDTPQVRPLPGASTEVGKVTACIPAARVLRNDEASRGAVLTALANYRISHFACHSKRDRDGISASSLLLHDHLTSPLTIEDISTLQMEHAELAYVSACDTTRAQPALADEGIHITGAFLLAGYRQVIGTLWGTDDDSALLIAGHVYEYLADDQAPEPAAMPAAQALHQAVLRLRDQSPEAPARWSGYVHVGR